MKNSIIRITKQLTTKQSQIVCSQEYPMYLRAGAGTGKTEVLVQKVLHILKNDPQVSLSNFAIITFTNKATEEMKDRISSILFSECVNKGFNGISDSGNLEIVNMADICTIHVFCERLIRRFGLQINIAPNFKVKSYKKEIANIISAVVNEYCGNSLLSDIPAYALERLLSAFFTHNSNHGIRIDEELSKILSYPSQENQYWNRFKILFLEIYNRVELEIEISKRKENVLTPNDLIRVTADLLKLPNVIDRVFEKYRYVFIDEFQDTNKEQFDLVNSLIKRKVKVFLIGDDKQSIYAFRGADVQNSQEMHLIVKNENKNGDKEYLSENFRSTREIIEVINSIFSHTFTFNGEPLLFPIEPLQTPSSAISDSNTSPILFEYGKPIKDIIQDVLNTTRIEGRPAQYSDIAILCRRNFDMERIAKELKLSYIPICVAGGKGFYRTQEVIDTYKLLNAIIYNNEIALSEVQFTDYSKSVIDTDINQLISEMQDIIRVETVDVSLTQLYERSGIIKYYKQKHNYQAVNNLLKLNELAQSLMNRDNMQPLQFVEYLHIMISTKQEEDEAYIPEIERNNGVVSLYSIHKAKGLSFPIVIIPCCDNKLNRPITKPKFILNLKSDNPKIAFNSETLSQSLPPDREYIRMIDFNVKEQLEEEIRVFYVACTRAKKQLVIASTNSEEQVVKTLKYRDYASVSKWLLEMSREKIKNLS